jgi:UrcA family protein
MFKLHRIVALLIALAVLPALFTGESAIAAASRAAEDPPSVTVRYQDLNLNSPEGIAVLYHRLRSAAAEICGPLDSRELARKVLWNDCFDHAVANAVRTVHNKTLSAYHWQRTRGFRQHEIEAPATVAAR